MSNFEILKESEKILGRPLTCIAPFEHLTFSCDGSIFPCCPALVNNYTYGHIFKDNTVEEIWNGEKAREFRQSIIDGNFKYCNLDSCISLKNLKDDPRFNSDFEKKHKDTFSSLPKEVHFHIDTACNARCITCRDEKHFMAQEVKKYDEMIEPVLIPILKNAERVYLNGAGELFASALCKKLVKRINEVYPNIKFNLSTNGILANEETLKEFGIRYKIISLEVSIHARYKETYDKIVLDGDYEAVMKNLKFISEMKKNNEIQCFWLNFVVTSYNYKEMIAFQELANELGAMTKFWEYRKWGNAKLDERYDEVAIFEPTHPDYDKYLEVVNNDIFNLPNCSITAKLRRHI